MSYNSDLTWDDLVKISQNSARSLINELHRAEEVERNWNSYAAGDSDATIASALGKSEAEITDLRACFNAFKALKDYANNQTPTQNNYLRDMRRFS